MKKQLRYALFHIGMHRALFGTVGLLLILSTGSDAALTLKITPGSQAGVNGDLLTYSATLQNDLTGTVFLNGDSVDLFASDVVADDTPFLFNAPLSLGPGAMWSGDVFTLTIGPTTPFQSYIGSFDIFGGPDANALDVIASAPFELIVQNVPEPTTAPLLLMTLGSVMFSRRILAAVVRLSK
jgi:hypothetical protein